MVKLDGKIVVRPESFSVIYSSPGSYLWSLMQIAAGNLVRRVVNASDVRIGLKDGDFVMNFCTTRTTNPNRPFYATLDDRSATDWVLA